MDGNESESSGQFRGEIGIWIDSSPWTNSSIGCHFLWRTNHSHKQQGYFVLINTAGFCTLKTLSIDAVFQMQNESKIVARNKHNAQGICARTCLFFFAWSESLSSHELWTFCWCQSISYELSRHTFLVHAVDAVSVRVLKAHGIVRWCLCCWRSHTRQKRETPHAAVLMCRGGSWSLEFDSLSGKTMSLLPSEDFLRRETWSQRAAHVHPIWSFLFHCAMLPQTTSVDCFS